MKTIVFICCLVLSLHSAVIIGSQDKVSSMSGTLDVESNGVSKTIRPGEISFTAEGQAPSDARRLQKGDIQDILEDTDIDKKIDLPIGTFSKVEATEVFKTLRKYIDSDKIAIKSKPNNKVEITIVNEYYAKLKNIFPKIKHLIKNP